MPSFDFHSGKDPAQLKQDPVSRLTFELSKLPGIGEKTATRLAYYILRENREYAVSLSEALLEAKDRIQLCSHCQSFTDTDPCRICSHPTRDGSIICVVESPSDVTTIENTAGFRGQYHVLHGVLSPLDGIGPEELKVRELLERVKNPEKFAVEGVPHEKIQEVIIATNPSIEGEATALYLSKILSPLGIRTTKLAYGIPVGGRLEFTDQQTISKALENRMEVHP